MGLLLKDIISSIIEENVLNFILAAQDMCKKKKAEVKLERKGIHLSSFFQQRKLLYSF